MEPMNLPTNCTYMLRCADGSLYVGWTNDLCNRIAAHNAGTGAKYTRSRRPVRLVYFERFETPREARIREAALKKLSHGEKEALLRGFDPGNGFPEGQFFPEV